MIPSTDLHWIDSHPFFADYVSQELDPLPEEYTFGWLELESPSGCSGPEPWASWEARWVGALRPRLPSSLILNPALSVHPLSVR